MAVIAAPKTSAATLPLFLSAHFTYHVCTGILIPLLPLIRDSFGLTYFQSGMLVSAFSLTQGLSQLPMGGLGDRLSLKKVLIGGLFSLAVITFVVGLTNSYYQLLALLIVMGILGGTYHPISAPFLARFYTAKHRGRVLGLHFVGGNASFLLTPMMAGLIASLAGWREAYLILALPAILVSLLFWHYVPDVTNLGGSSATQGQKVSTREMVSLLRPIALLLAVAFTFQMVSAAVQAFLPLFLVDRHGIAPIVAAILVGIGWGAGMVGGPVGGILSDRLGRRPVILMSIILTGPCMFLITIWGLGPFLVLSLLAYGAANTLKAPVMESLLIDLIPPERRSTFLGMYFLINQELGGVVTPLVGGLIDWQGLYPVFTALAIVATLGSVVVFIARRRI